MRKHFLILMLLTLLPLATWATKPTAANASAVAVKATQEWTNQPLGLVETAVKLPDDYDTSVGRVYYIALLSSQAAPIKSNPGWSTDLPTRTDINQYKVYYYITNDGTASYDEDGDVTLIETAEITKATIKAANITSPVAPVADESRKYNNGAPVNLVTAPEFTGIISDEIITEYSTDGGSSWSTDIPTATVCGSDVTIQWRTQETTHYESYTAGADVTTSLNKADLTTGDITLPTVISGLKYTGVKQQIFSANGVSTRGTVYFNVNNQGWRYAENDDAAKANLTPGTHDIPYYVVASDPTNYNNWGDAFNPAGNIQVTIANGEATATAPTLVSNWTFDGLEKSLLATAGSATNGTLVYYLGDDEVTEANVKALNAGTYTVSYSVTGNTYFDGIEKQPVGTVTVSQKPLTVAAKTVTKDWDGQANTLSDLYTASGFVAADDANKATILADLLDVNVSTTDAMGATDAGVHTVTLSEKAGQVTNYTADFLVETSSLTINKVDPNLTTAPAAVENLVYAPETPQTLVSAGEVANNYGTVEYKLGEGEWGTITNAQAIDAGYYTVSYRVVGDKNHNDLTGADVAASIAKADNTVTVALEGWTYNAQANAPTATATNGTPEFTYAVEGGSEWGTYDAIVNGKAGNYTVKAAVAESANYKAGEATDNFTIAQAANNVTVAIEGWTYGEEAKAPTTSATFGEAVVTYAVKDSETFGTYDEIVNGQAGNYTVKAAVAATTDYAAAEATADFTIAKAANTVTVALEGWAYGATANEPTATATDGTPEFTYAVAGGSEWGTYDAIVNGKAGSYTVKAAVAESANYNAGEATANFTIAKAANTVTVAIEGWTYGEEAKAPTTSATFGEAVVTYAVKDSETFGTYDEIVNGQAGNYTVKAAVAGTTDYAAAEATANFEIAKADVVATAPQALTLTYNGAAQTLVTAGEATGAEIQFLNGEEWTTAIPQEKNAGAYTVQYKYVADANHNEKAGGEIAVNIQKFNLKFELGNKDADWTGEQIPAEGAYILSVGALQGDDKIGEEGAFSLAFPEEVKNAGTYNFNKLTPTFNNDVENYTILFSGNAEVKVNAVDIVAADFTAPAAVEDALIFNGKAQTLFVAGEMVNNYGEIQYSADGETWSAELTDALKKGTAAAEYKLFYKVVSDGNHNDFVAEAPLTKTIAAKAWAAKTVAFLGGNLEYTYNKANRMPAAADLELFDGKNKLTADDYELVITNTQIDPETEEPVVATEAINADTYTFTYTGKGNFAGNESVYTLTINKKEIEDVFALNVEEAEYTSEDQIASVTVTNTGSLVENTDYTVEKPAQAINKGQYDVTITLSGNYTFAENENAVVKQFEITPAQILISAGDVEKTYDGLAGLAVAGKAALQPELNYAGLKKNDKVEDVITNVAAGAVTVKDAAAAAAEYALGIDLTKFTVAEGNYTVKANDVQGKLTINKRDMAITFADRDEEGNYLISKAYGAEDDFADVDALVELDNNVAADAETIIAGITVSRSNADVNAVGKYDGVLEIATEGDVFANYNVTATDKGDFEITAGKLTIALKKAAGKVYDGVAPEASWTVSAADLAVTGMEESDKIEDIFTTMPTATIQAPAKDAATYVIKLSGAVAPNYEIGSYLDGQYIITPKALSATVEDQTVQIDAEELPHPAAFVINGAVEGDELNAQLSINASTATAGVFAQGIELTIDNANYTLPATYGVLTVIDPAAVAQFDVKDADVFDAIKAAEGATTANITGREVASKEWIAFILPFDVTVEKLCDVFGYSIINTYDAKNSSASHMKFQIEQDGVPANTPFIIKPKKAYAADKNMTFEDVVVKAPASAKVEIEVGGNTFVGQYEEFTIVKKDVPNSTYLRAGGWKRAKNSDRVIEPFDCYITWPEGVEAPTISLEDEGGVTKIATITTDGRIIEAEGWYTVNGMKLDAAPTEKGVYIKDGKKVVIK